MEGHPVWKRFLPSRVKVVPFLKRNLCTNGLKWKWMFILECKLFTLTGNWNGWDNFKKGFKWKGFLWSGVKAVSLIQSESALGELSLTWCSRSLGNKHKWVSLAVEEVIGDGACDPSLTNPAHESPDTPSANHTLHSNRAHDSNRSKLAVTLYLSLSLALSLSPPPWVRHAGNGLSCFSCCHQTACKHLRTSLSWSSSSSAW